MRKKKVVWPAAVAVASVAAAGVGVSMAWAKSGADDSASSKTDCEVTRLAKDWGSVNDVSASGEYIAGDTYDEDHAEADRTPTLWHKGDTEDLMPAVSEAIPDVTSAVVEGINSDGVAAGTTEFDGGQPFRYQSGEAEALTVPEAPGGEELDVFFVAGISDDGTILGTAQPEGQDVSYTVAWESGNAEGSFVESPEGLYASDITEDGTLVGSMSDGTTGVSQAWVKAPGEDWKDLKVKGLKNLYDQPVVSGDWLLADEFRVNLAEGGKAEKHELTEEYDGETRGNASAIDAEGHVYGRNADDVPVMGFDGETTKLPYDKDAEVPALPEVVNAEGSVIAGQVTTGEDEHATAEPYAWSCQE